MKSHEQNIQQEESQNSAYDAWRSLGDEVPFRQGGINSYEQYQERRQQVQKLIDRDEANKSALIEAMRKYRDFKQEQIQKERQSELLEREFNNTMTTPQELARALAEGEEGISLSYIEYEGHQIPVYELTGHELRFLQHVVDYKIDDRTITVKGRETARALLEDPSKWRSSQIEQKANAENGESMLTDNISTSYIDANLNLTRRGGANSKYKVVYGFTHLDQDELVETSRMDNRTDAFATVRDINLSGDYLHDVRQHEATLTPEKLARVNKGKDYNEVVISRYQDNGEPVLPDTMITHASPYDPENGITEYTLRHAAYFDIPIIRIHDQEYRNQAISEYRQEIQDLQQEDLDYLDLFATLDHINNNNMILVDTPIPYRTEFDSDSDYHPTEDFTLDDQNWLEKNLDSSKDKFIHLIEKVEPERRLEYLIEQLTSDTLPDQDIFVELGNKNIGNGQKQEYIKITLVDNSIPQTVITSDFSGYDQIVSAVDTYIQNGGHVFDNRQSR